MPSLGFSKSPGSSVPVTSGTAGAGASFKCGEPPQEAKDLLGWEPVIISVNAGILRTPEPTPYRGAGVARAQRGRYRDKPLGYVQLSDVPDVAGDESPDCTETYKSVIQLTGSVT